MDIIYKLPNNKYPKCTCYEFIISERNGLFMCRHIMELNSRSGKGGHGGNKIDIKNNKLLERRG